MKVWRSGFVTLRKIKSNLLSSGVCLSVTLRFKTALLLISKQFLVSILQLNNKINNRMNSNVSNYNICCTMNNLVLQLLSVEDHLKEFLFEFAWNSRIHFWVQIFKLGKWMIDFSMGMNESPELHLKKFRIGILYSI